MHAITIAARNYLAMARTVATSFTRANPGSSFTILVVDAQPDEIPSSEDYDIATPHELPLHQAEFGRMAFLYDVTELSTALKPWALEMLLDRGAEVAVYLDPDIYVYSSMHEVEVQALKHGIVLTPHTVTPMPRDGLRPSEADIMGSGIYNLGFIAVQKGDRDMLSWWQQRLLRDSISAPEQMLFTDQRWIDLVPGYFDHSVLRDPGYNVAYWNLDSREITIEDGEYRVNGEPLRFFHFSGYRPETPWILSKYVADHPRVVLSEHPIVRRLCDEYAEQLRLNGVDRSAGTPYRFNRFQDGTPITTSLRRLYRSAVIEAERNHTEFPPAPFDEDGDAAILAWLREPVRPGTWVNRVVQALWQSRADLQKAFPNPMGSDQAAFLEWCMSSGVRESGLVATVLPTQQLGNDGGDSPATISTDVPGVNLVGYFRTETGVGQIGRLLVDAVKATGLPYSTLPVTRTVSRQDADFDEIASNVRYPINVVSVNADQFPLWAEETDQSLLRDRYTIGVWAWEVEDFPDAYTGALELVDEVWAISRFVQESIQRKTDKPVHVIPYQVPDIRPVEDLDREALGLPDAPYFLFMFDYLSVFERKNPLGVVEAFCQAFEENEGPILVIKSVNGDRFRTQRERLRMACSRRSDIFLIEDYLSYQAVESLVANSAAYVSLHRAEGLGLTMSESMSAGRPVIATAYSGNLDFMDEQNSLLVPYRLVEIPESAQPYGPPTRWAEPNVDIAAGYMRWIIANPDGAAELALRGQESVHSQHGLDRSADFVAERVRAIFQERMASAPDPEAAAPEPGDIAAEPWDPELVLDQSQQLLNTVVDVDTPSRLPAVAKAARRIVQRALAHHDEQVNLRLNALLHATRVSHRTQADRLAAVTEHTNQQLMELQSRLDAAQQELVSRAELVELAAQRSERIQELDKRISTTAARTDGIASRTDDLAARTDDIANRTDDLAAQLEAQTDRIDTLSVFADENRASLRAHDQRFTDVSDRLAETDAQLVALDAESAAAPYQSDPTQLRIRTDAGQVVLGYDASTQAEASYAGFEDVFRGSEEFIAERLTPYLELVREHGTVLDVGCGRGEFLALLQAHQIAHRGVDSDPSMVERARARGLDAVLGDGLELLRSCEPGSFGAVTSFQVVEHLQPAAVQELFTDAYRALESGGVLIAETVNPHSPAALKTFWLDLTHVRPLFPESLLFLAREAGFVRAEIVFPHGTGELASDLRRSGEYALVAYK